MSHYYALAVIPKDGDVTKLLEETLAPYNEEREVESYEENGETYWRNPVGLWDWYQVGGRWTGVLSGYDPAKDPKNVEECWLCQGTGKRDDAIGRQFRTTNPGYTCNGCNGEGKSVKWPTSWGQHDGDVVDALSLAARLADLNDNQLPYAIFAHGSESVSLRERWDPTVHGKHYTDCNAATCDNEWHKGTFVEEHDKEDMRAVLATILSARLAAGLSDRVVVVDYHS